MTKLTPDGYRIIPKLPDMYFADDLEKGVQCGECGMKFDHNKAYGYACGKPNCPIQLKSSFCHD